MKDLVKFNIPFVGLKLGNHVFEYEIDNTFFEAFDFNEFHSSNIKVKLDLVKKNTLFELNFVATGTVNVDCDISLEPYDQQVKGNFSLIVKFGIEYNDDNDEILILPHEAYQIDVSQFIYELIILSIPTKRIHPKVLDGSLESEALKKLKELEIDKESPSESEDAIDPRWDKLKGLITEKRHKMAHPKRKISKTRRDKRRTHYKASMPQIAVDPTTGEAHLYHRAHWHEGKLYYRGQIVLDSNAAEA